MYKRLPIIILVLTVTIAAGFDYKLSTLAFKGADEVVSSGKDCIGIDNSSVIINASDCGTNNGSVIGLQAQNVTGNAVWTWYDINNNVVGHAADLINVGEGTYRVTLRDDSKCAAAQTLVIVGLNNPLKINDAGLVIKAPSCGKSDGAITGIQFNTPPVSYKWVSADDPTKLVSTQKDLLNVPAGNYILTAINVTGCIATEKYGVFPTGGFPTMTYYTYTNSDCGATGSFHATFDIKPTDPSYFYTIDDINGKTLRSGQLAYSSAIDSARIAVVPSLPTMAPPTPALAAGTYTLNITSGTCRVKFLTFTIGLDKIKLDTAGMHIRPDICGNNTGAISAINISGFLQTYAKDPDQSHGWFWTDSTGRRLATRNNSIANVPAGKYSVHAVNIDGCSTDTMTFIIPDSISKSSKPILNDVKMCLPGKAVIDVQNKDPSAGYRLYDSTKTLIDSSRAGYFLRKVDQTTVFYVQAVNGYCGSPLGKIAVTVINPGVSLTNAFTPNGDGINDFWVINGLEEYPGTEVSVFNRYGQRVYHSINYAKPFDGRLNGKQLPDGVYYYIVDTKKPDCRGGITGNLTILR